MDIETLKSLASANRQRLPVWQETMASIHSLEAELGLPESPKIFNISQGRARLEELTRMRSRIATAAPAPAAAAPVKPSATPATLTTAQLLKVSTEVNPGHGFWKFDGEAQQRAAAAQWFHCRHLTYPGCESDFAALAEESARRQPLASYDGLARSARAFTQASINSAIKRITGASK